ncbi:MAG: ribonuclease E/G [Clostridia bacterium]|nr:ribonuclease E/G [Clostridia bacterium]
MSKRVLIETREGKRRIAVMEDQRLLCLKDEAPQGARTEQIYLGVVDRLAPGMEAAFVRLGRETTGFLPFSECRTKPRSGDAVPVQVKKPAIGDKAPYLTQDVALAGRYAILTPYAKRIALSKKILNEGAKARLAALAEAICPPEGGLVMRTESENADEESIRRDIEGLRAEWLKTLSRLAAAKAPCLIRDTEDALARLLRDERGPIEKILCDDPEALQDVSLPVEKCERPFTLFSVDAKWEKACQKKVWLDCGGYLIVEKTEALTVIDVNSGKYTGNRSGTENTFLRLNLEAAREIARLMRLRSMGGIVIVDFVDMQKEESRQAVLSELEACVRDDPVKVALHGFTSLGLMELTRKKTDAQI